MKIRSATVDRWKKAQEYEKAFWEKQAYQTALEGVDRFKWYKDRAAMVYERSREFLNNFENIAALEIGSGPIGLINYISASDRYALDPLENFNKTVPEIKKARDPNVKYISGTGEDVSSLKKIFNFVILDNVLDHCQDPGKVLSEINKNLEKKGILFFSINVYTEFGMMIRNIMEFFEIDKGHPFNFTEKSICSLLKKSGFEIIAPKKSDYENQKIQYRKSNHLRNKIKGYLGLTDIRFSCICRKN